MPADNRFDRLLARSFGALAFRPASFQSFLNSHIHDPQDASHLTWHRDLKIGILG
jgi:hypothetical protein